MMFGIKKVYNVMVRMAFYTEDISASAKIFCLAWIIIFLTAGLFDAISDNYDTDDRRGRSEDQIQEQLVSGFGVLGDQHFAPQTNFREFNKYYSFFDARRKLVYTNQPQKGGQIIRKPTRREKFWFAEVRTKAAATIGHHNTSACHSIRYRLLEGRGMEEEVTCEINGETINVSLLEPFSDYILQEAPRLLNKLHTLNIILTLKGRIDSLQRFLSSTKTVMELNKKMSIIITIIYFEDSASPEMIAAVKPFTNIPNLKIEFDIEPLPFIRGKGLKIGLDRSSANMAGSVVWLADVDMEFSGEFITRCLSTPSKGEQIYFPVVWSEYNPKLWEATYPDPSSVEARNDAGYWRIYGFGNVCGYKEDLMVVSESLVLHSNSWGGEDLDLLEGVLETNQYKVIRSLEPGLVHRYHPKYCGNITDLKTKDDCTKVQILDEASQYVYGDHYFKNIVNNNSNNN